MSKTINLEETIKEKVEPKMGYYSINWENIKTIEDYTEIWKAIGLTLQFDLNQMQERADEMVSKGLISKMEVENE
jgi:hypothetical protein